MACRSDNSISCPNVLKKRRSVAGFTLIELVAVMVLLGIVGVASVKFIRQGVEIYSDTVGRDQLQQRARYAIERMSRELRNALPGSVRVASSSDGSTQCIEFMPIIAGSTYLNPLADAVVTSVEVVDVISAGNPSGDRLAVYPIDSAELYNLSSTNSPLRTITGFTDSDPNDGKQMVTISSSAPFAHESPTRRFYIVDPNPVSFCARNGALTRHSGYALSATQGLPPANGLLLAEHIRLNDGGPVAPFSYSSGTTQRAGVVYLDLRFSHTATLGDEWLRFSQAVFVRNRP